ncbi:hypothetical protein PTKIN_Ptkin14bG0049600 [Pterospermum kingtungense]
METKSIVLITLTVFLSISATVRADYVRPQPRKTLHFPWNPKHPSQPQQVHISLAGENHMRISWITDDKSAPSIVEYGMSPGQYSSSAEGETTSYSYIFYSSGKIHHTVIGPLEHDTVYFYRCGGQGPEFQLKTPPAQFPVTFAVAGDLGQTGWTKTTLDHIDQCHYDIHLLPGDLSYADCLQHRWDTFGELVQPLASARPWMVTEGNHEKEKIPLFTDAFTSYNARWKMPFQENYDEQSGQYSWLKVDLSKVDRKKTPWLVVLFHVPWYNSNNAHQGEGDGMMAAMEPLLYAAGVDIVLAGHVHAYERSNRVNNGNSDRCGTVHITIGDGGNKEGLAQKYREPRPEWSLFREASFGHGELKIVNSTHAFWSWHRNDDDEPVRSDQVWITSLMSAGCLEEKSYELKKMLMAP